jgi:hypothetical protein
MKYKVGQKLRYIKDNSNISLSHRYFIYKSIYIIRIVRNNNISITNEKGTRSSFTFYSIPTYFKTIIPCLSKKVKIL